MVMPNKTYELRKLYFQQSRYSAKPAKVIYTPLLKWPENGYFENFKSDANLLQKALMPDKLSQDSTIADQVFGNQKKLEYLGLKHLANIFYERCKIHKKHIRDIDHRHLDIQKKKFGIEINKAADQTRRLTGLEGQLLQLEQQRRDEELDFWKDTVELRARLFEGAAGYKDANHRHGIFSDVEEKYA